MANLSDKNSCRHVRLVVGVIAAVQAGLLFGCSGPPKDLAGELKKLGVTKKAAERVVLWKYSEPLDDYVEVPVYDPELIDWIWHAINKSKSYGVWYLPEDQGINFYVAGQDEPAAVLIVNDRDACRVVGARRYKFGPDAGMRVNMHTVRGLHVLLNEYLDSRENFLLAQPAAVPAGRPATRPATRPAETPTTGQAGTIRQTTAVRMPGVPISPSQPARPEPPLPKPFDAAVDNPPGSSAPNPPASAPASVQAPAPATVPAAPPARTAPLPRQD
ncbi:MAG: hypothetical protein HZA50_05590 [Planctomycetes bacterium]|nr:hypothetical protein [Planctomycetota bacterium]